MKQPQRQRQQLQKLLKKVSSFLHLKNSNSYFLEIFLKSNDAPGALATIPSIDIDESNDISHRPLAPLASSETFTDVAAIIRDDIAKEESEILTRDNEQTSRKTTESDFDSLEILFDFPSSGISSDTHFAVETTTQNCNHIRFSDTNQIIKSDKVEEQKVLRIEKIDSPPIQQRSRLDSSGATANALANQTTSQNVLWLCKKMNLNKFSK